jgi:hypothetical protein
MLRNRGPAHRQSLSQFADGLGPFGQALEHLPAGRVGEGGESEIVSHDLP